MNGNRVKTDFEVIVLPTVRRGIFEVAVRNGAEQPWTDRCAVARAADRKRLLGALAAQHPDIDGSAIEAKLLEAAASDRKARGRSRTPVPARDTEPFAQKLTDIANSLRFARMHGGDVRFIPTLGGWHCWDGRRWVLDETGEILRLARETQRSILREAAKESSPENQAALSKHALATAAKPRLQAMIDLAQSEPGIALRASDVDADAFLFNVANGTLDLRTGELREHRRDDHITKLAPVHYDPTARSARWERLLREATNGDAELEVFLQRWCGYCLTGDTREEKLALVHGPPAASKSTFLEAFKAVLGDYACTADAESFCARKNGGGPRDDLARLAGARLVVTIEIDRGRRFAEGLVKQLTGGDTICVRHLYARAFEFRPAFKLVFAANDAPRIRHDDRAMWRRVLLIPFIHEVPPEKRDASLKQELGDPARSGSAILAWAVKGCLLWQERGLEVPECVAAATAGYRSAQDPLQAFIGERCRLGLDDEKRSLWTSWAALKAAYDEFTDGDRFRVSAADFREGLRARGCEPGKRGEARGWFGIALVDAATGGEVP
jgi:putative DNA primase/helicase